jgi:hypothetical protein
MADKKGGAAAEVETDPYEIVTGPAVMTFRLHDLKTDAPFTLTSKRATADVLDSLQDIDREYRDAARAAWKECPRAAELQKIEQRDPSLECEPRREGESEESYASRYGVTVLRIRREVEAYKLEHADELAAEDVEVVAALRPAGHAALVKKMQAITNTDALDADRRADIESEPDSEFWRGQAPRVLENVVSRFRTAYM